MAYVVYETWMNDQMKADAVHYASLAVEMHRDYSNIASYIKTEFDKKHGRTWHCIVYVASYVGYYVDPKKDCFINFSLERLMVKASIQVHSTTMRDEMQRDALQCALLAVNMYDAGTDISNYMKQEFERKHGRTWHCIVGITEGYAVGSKDDFYIDFSVGNRKIVLFHTA